VVRVDDPIVRIAALFDALSSTYDAVGVDFFQPIAASLLSALPPTAGERWLDVGCGRGAVLLKAARAVGLQGAVSGVDISEGMVALVNEACASMSLDNAHAIVGNAMALPFDDESFDVICSSLVLFFLPEPASAVRSWLPLLVPGGRVGVTTFGAVDERWDFVDDVLTPFLPPALLDARASGQRGPFASNDGMEELLRSAGFVDVRTVVDSIPVRFASADQWYEFSWSVGQRMMWLAVPDEHRADVKAEAMARFASVADVDGSVVFAQEIRHTLARRAD
jgi:ubiquinone/menaquinone biosynthesis C-methylase UbiE